MCGAGPGAGLREGRILEAPGMAWWRVFRHLVDESRGELRMKKPIVWHLRVLLAAVALIAVAAPASANPPARPGDIAPTDITVAVEEVATMPFELGPGFVVFVQQPNLASPVTIKNKLYLIDQNDGIYRLNGEGDVQKIFDVDQAPDGLQLDNRQAVLNVAPGPTKNTMYVAFTSGSEPTTNTPTYRMPDPLAGVCCNLAAPLPVADLFRIGTIPDPSLSFLFGDTRTEYQVIYEYDIRGDSIQNPRAIAAFETQSGPTHNGGGMVRLPDGRLLFATGDALPFGADGRTAAQDPSEIVSKLVIVDPDDGSIELAAIGLRNVQLIDTSPDGQYIGFGDIGGVTAEEVNYLSVADVVDTNTVENFGWGRNADGLAREGTFYVGPGVPMVGGTEPPVLSSAPVPEPGFIQPQSQYDRIDPNGGVAVSGPVTSDESFDQLTAVFTDLASGLLYGSTAAFDAVDATVFNVNLVDGDGNEIVGGFNTLAGGRADPRLFRFPDGTAGVLLEATGTLYRLTEVDPT